MIDKLILIGSILALPFLWAKKAFSWSDVSGNTASFTSAGVLPAYKEGGSYQWGGKLADNTGYVWRRGDLGIMLWNELFTAGQEKDFDTNRDYTSKFVFTQLENFAAEQVSILEMSNDIPTRINLLGLNYNTGISGYIDGRQFFKIKALASGGFRMYNTSLSNWYLCGYIFEIRNEIGA